MRCCFIAKSLAESEFNIGFNSTKLCVHKVLLLSLWKLWTATRNYEHPLISERSGDPLWAIVVLHSPLRSLVFHLQVRPPRPRRNLQPLNPAPANHALHRSIPTRMKPEIHLPPLSSRPPLDWIAPTAPSSTKQIETAACRSTASKVQRETPVSAILVPTHGECCMSLQLPV